MDVTILPVKTLENLPPSYGETFFPKRMERAKRFLKQEDQLRCMGAGVLLHEVLGIRETDITLNEWKKPIVKDVHFNLSHSGDYVILTSDRDEIGCDIEQMHPKHFEVAKRVFLPEELAWMQEDPLTRFFVLWTLKESVMKQQGMGFALAPETFSVLPLIQGEGLKIKNQIVYAASTQYDQHMISVCATHPLEEISLRCLRSTFCISR